MCPLSGMSVKSDIIGQRRTKMAKWVEKRWDETYRYDPDKDVYIITKYYGTRKARLIRTTATKQA